MLVAQLENAKVLKQLVDSIKDLVAEVNLECDAEGITMQAMDSSHVALVFLKIGVQCFQQYSCEGNLNLGVSIPNFAKILRCAGNDDRTLIRSDGQQNITFQFEDAQTEKLCEFSLNLLHLDAEHLGIPEVDYQVETVIQASEFNRICKELSNLSDTLNIEVNSQSCKFSVAGEVGTGSITLREGMQTDNLCKITAANSCNLSFALRYLNLFNKASSLTDRVTFKMAPEYPLMIEYVFKVNSEGNEGILQYYLAPKIEDK